MSEPNPQNWTPISEENLLRLIASAETAMDDDLSAFWNRIRVRSVKWQLSPIGDLGGGFWVVAVIGQQCIWYNDIEDGFNISMFDRFGTIGEYRCNQSELQHLLHWFAKEFP